jgi:hypothetical protein
MVEHESFSFLGNNGRQKVEGVRYNVKNTHKCLHVFYIVSNTLNLFVDIRVKNNL